MSIRGPLSGVIFLLAQEQADEIAGMNDDPPGAFAALFRDAPDLARRTRELLESDEIDVGPEAVDPEDLELLESAAGVVVRREEDGTVSVQPYRSDDELAAAWSAVMVELEPSEPGSQAISSPESDDNPT